MEKLLNISWIKNSLMNFLKCTEKWKIEIELIIFKNLLQKSF